MTINDYGAVILSQRENTAWLTGGRDFKVLRNSDTAFGVLLISLDQVYLIAQYMDIDRIYDDELEGLDIEKVELMWYEQSREGKAVEMAGAVAIVADSNIVGADCKLWDLYWLHYPLMESEIRKRMKDITGHYVTQKEVASAIGVSRSTIGLYEIGENVPDIKTLTKLAEYYHTTTNFLLGIDERPNYENNFISKAINLSDKAIAELKNLKLNLDKNDSNEKNSKLLNSINYLLCTNHGKELLVEIWDYLFPIDEETYNEMIEVEKIGWKAISDDSSIKKQGLKPKTTKNSIRFKSDSNTPTLTDNQMYGATASGKGLQAILDYKRFRASYMLDIQERLRLIGESIKEGNNDDE